MDRYVQYGAMAEQVLIRPQPAASGDPNQKDVRVDIAEGMSGMIMPGIGVSSDNGIMGQLVIHQQNFDITDWPQSWAEFFGMKAFRGGGQSLRVALEPGTEVSRYTVSFTDPYFRDRPISFELAGRKYQRFLRELRRRQALRSGGVRAPPVGTMAQDPGFPCGERGCLGHTLRRPPGDP